MRCVYDLAAISVTNNCGSFWSKSYSGHWNKKGNTSCSGSTNFVSII